MKKESLRILLVQSIASSLFLILFIILASNSFGQTTVYIDPSYTGSTQNGTMANPYKSWNSVNWVNGNTYLQKAGTTFNTSGGLSLSSKSNITIGAYGTGIKPKIISSAASTSKVITITSSSNIQVNGLEVSSTSNMVAAVIISGTGAGNNLINNCVLHDVQWGIRILTTSAGNRILNCEVFNTQDDGIYIKDTPDIEIGYCNIYNVNLKYFVNPDQSYSPGDNIQIASTNSHNFYIHHNTLDHSTTGNKFCFIAWGNNYTGILEYNTMIGHPNKSVSCMYLSPTTGSVTARYNSFIDGNYGVYSYVSNFQVYYNEFINSRIAISVLTDYHLLAENNVFYNSTANNISALSGSTVISKNNIFYLSGTAKAYSTSGSLTSNYNVFNVQSTGFINGHSTLSAWRSASGQDMNSMVANPNFVNPAENNFSLQPNSPCINAGTLCGYNQDYFGNNVPQGSSSDVGYHEFTSSTNNQPPVIQNQTFSVNENIANGTVVGQVIATDPDAGQTITYSITGGNTGSAFSINSTTGIISVANSQYLDFESNPTFNLQISVLDNLGLSSSATVVVNLQDVNENPIINDQGFNINENMPNGGAVGIVIASDPDNGQQLTYSITNGNLNNTFALNSTTGALTVNNNQLINFETNSQFQLTVKVQDNGAGMLSDYGTITVNILDVNEAPIVANQNFSVSSSATNGTSVGQVIASDPDVNQVLAYYIISGNQNNTFFLNSNTGIISINNSVGLSGTSSFSLGITVNDNGSPQLSSNCIVTITVTSSANSAPVIQAQSFSIQENSANGTVLGQVVASDPDSGQTLAYTILSGNTSGAFYLTSQGVLGVSNSSVLNFEVQSSYILVVRVTDNGNPQLSSQNNITVSVIDINEAPIVVAGQSFDVLTTAQNGHEVGLVLSEDEDVNQTVQYAIIGGNSHDAFAIDQFTGMLTVANSDALKKLSNKSVKLNIQVTDNGTPSLHSSDIVNIRVFRRKNAVINFAGDEMAAKSCNIYPNPSNNGNFTIEMDLEEETLMALKVTDINGSILYTTTAYYSSNHELNLSHLPKGIYLLQIIKEGSSDIKKLIIQ
jgi:hypothetical protein